ncbi:hypothetical protein HAP47_0028215 [Bradyrhizobium sp. 41S5]|uniref:Uncharacterized protein n=1 Tax=Bradyrhizobium quebecense TaxID=2748629 RepID=A0A939LJF5_9BRAD|nr:hypothetical protein [Bradyrhizobium australafricanum]UFX43090.1 hypothetical protein HAP47_0028215 [Bradyrhizobium sp. 41S5]
MLRCCGNPKALLRRWGLVRCSIRAAAINQWRGL